MVDKAHSCTISLRPTWIGDNELWLLGHGVSFQTSSMISLSREWSLIRVYPLEYIAGPTCGDSCLLYFEDNSEIPLQMAWWMRVNWLSKPEHCGVIAQHKSLDMRKLREFVAWWMNLLCFKEGLFIEKCSSRIHVPRNYGCSEPVIPGFHTLLSHRSSNKCMYSTILFIQASLWIWIGWM